MSTLTAVYKSPLSGGAYTFSHPLPAPSSPDAKTQHLSDLRAAVVKLQVEVNAYLTEQMEVEKRVVEEENDVVAEEKYGEEGGEVEEVD